MVDREARKKMAELLRHLASGTITYGQYREAAPASRDSAVRLAYELAGEVWDDGMLAVEDIPADYRFAQDQRLDREDRRLIARTILFLQTDREYRWFSRPISWRTALLLTPVLCIGLFFASAVASALIAELGSVGALAGVGLAFTVDALYGRAIGRDRRLWPFYRRAEYEEALTHPKLLSGRVTP